MRYIKVALAITILGLVVDWQFSKGESKKRKHIIWGNTILVAIALFLSISIGLTYAFIVRNGWAGLIMWVLFPSIFILELIVLLIGVYKEKGTLT